MDTDPDRHGIDRAWDIAKRCRSDRIWIHTLAFLYNFLSPTFAYTAMHQDDLPRPAGSDRLYGRDPVLRG
jgi:hypothetical protein